MKHIIGFACLLLLAGCGAAEKPVHFVCSGVGIPAEDPTSTEALSGWSLAIQHDERGRFWGNAELDSPGAILPERYNFVSASGQILTLGQSASTQAGRFNRITGELELHMDAGKVLMTCVPTEPLV